MSNKRAVWILAVLAIAGCRTAEESRPEGSAQNRESQPRPGGSLRESRESPEDSIRRLRRDAQSRLETSYDALEARLDSLWADSLNVRGTMRAQYRRILREARTVKDNTKVHLEELRVSSEGVTPEIWEEIRARTELSLDSLRRLFISADSTRKLEPAGKAAGKSP